MGSSCPFRLIQCPNVLTQTAFPHAPERKHRGFRFRQNTAILLPFAPSPISVGSACVVLPRLCVLPPLPPRGLDWRTWKASSKDERRESQGILGAAPPLHQTLCQGRCSGQCQRDRGPQSRGVPAWRAAVRTRGLGSRHSSSSLLAQAVAQEHVARAAKQGDKACPIAADPGAAVSLYLGSWLVERDLAALTGLGITHIIQASLIWGPVQGVQACARRPRTVSVSVNLLITALAGALQVGAELEPSQSCNDFTYCSIPLYDDETEPLLQHLPTCCSFIEAARSSGGGSPQIAAGKGGKLVT